MTVPYWVQDQVFYQIFPDRFANGSPDNDPPNVQKWGSPPSLRGFQGGDLRGIVRRFDYLLELGITALYLCPIFQSASNHRYHINDYFMIDPTLGTMDDFKALLDVAHQNNVKVVLDGVFNHSGRGFFAFNDILENGNESRYLDWYHVKGFPLNAFESGDNPNYEAWWDMKDLPKFNTNTPAVRKYILDVTRYWLEQGIDGWRLDVPAEIDDDSFWAEFRQTVKTTNPEAYTVGEIWDINPRWVGDSHFDGLMHYPVRDALKRLYSGELNSAGFAAEVEKLLTAYPRENVYAMYVPMGSHDTRRLWTICEGDINKVKLAFLLQFAYPGAPAIYYGDEVGIDGGKDPDNRKAFPWDQQEWNMDLYTYVKQLVAVRKRSAALRRGEMTRVALDEASGMYAFARTLGEDKVVVVMNASGEKGTAQIPVGELGWPDGITVLDLIGYTKYGVSEGMMEVELEGWQGVMIGRGEK